MQCLTNEQIQLLIDKEMDEQDETVCRRHLEDCPHCRMRVEEQRSKVRLILEALNREDDLPEMIPAFRYPVGNAPKKERTFTHSIWMKIAAVTIPSLLCWHFWPEKEPQLFHPSPEAIVNYELCNGVDANTAWQENMIITTVTDANGKIVQCSGY